MKNFRIHPATWFFLFLLMVTGFSSVIIPYLFAITFHELAHAFVAKKLGYGLSKVWILPYGACVSFDDYTFKPEDEIKIAIAGPLINVLFIVLTVMLWWIFPVTYVYTYTFVISNFSIALFNLLPAFPLDGGRILSSILKTKYKSKSVYRIICILNFVFSVIFLLIFIISCFYGINFSFGIISIFLFMGIIDGHFQGKYEPLLLQIKKKKQITSVKSICVSSSVPFYKIVPELNCHKFNVIYVRFPNGLKLVTEDQFQKFLENSPLDSTFDSIYQNKKSPFEKEK